MAERITWDNEIKDYFTQLDIGCMRARSLDLSDYASVKIKVARIFEMVQSGKMPKGDRCWPQEKIDRFKSWKDDGCPKTETDPGPPAP
jgi:hypothetical protein